jgi:hypothetical protein
MSKRDTKKTLETVIATEFIFSNELSFHEAFPEIEDLCMTVTETEGEATAFLEKSKLPLHSKRVYGTNVRECIDCHSPFCVNGGFSIREILRTMVRIHEHSNQGTKLCQGSGGMPKRSRRSLPCNHCFRFKIEVTYKGEAARGLGVEASQTRYENHEDRSTENSWFKNLSARSQQPLPE